MPDSTWQAMIVTTSIMAAIACLVIRWRGGLVLQTRQSVRLFFVVWLGVFLAEYAVGPSSFIFMDDEGDYSIPILNYLTHFHDGGQFAHALGGGVDRWAAFVVGVHAFSPELVLFTHLPTWAGILVLKAVVASVWFMGAYRLARVAGGTRAISAAIAALSPLTQLEFYDHTTWNGLGFGLMPLLAWLGPGRADRRWRVLSLIAITVCAAFSDPTHTAKAMGAAIILATIVLRRPFWSGAVLPVFAAATGAAINAMESLYAMVQMAPLSFRGASGLAVARQGLNDVDFIAISKVLIVNPMAFAVVLTAILILTVANRRGQAIRLAVAMVLLPTTVLAFLTLPWDLLGLAVIAEVGTGYIGQAATVIAILGAALAGNAWAQLTKGTQSVFLQNLVATVLLTLSVGAMVRVKCEHLKLWIMDGGQAQYHTIENLASPNWAPQEPFRVVTLRNRRPEPNLAFGFYGLHTLDGSLNMVPEMLTRFWHLGVLHGEPLGKINYLSLDWNYFWCCGNQYDITAQADIDLLRVANVGYLISPVPVKGLNAVSAPTNPPIIEIKSPDDRYNYYSQALARMRFHGPVYVYSLDEPLPRVFAAQAVMPMAAGTDDTTFLREIAANALHRVAVVRGSLLPATVANTMSIERYELVRDGFDITVSAPDGGVVLVNTSHLPFWRVWIDDVAGEAVPANFIHMAIQVPPGGRHVKIRYCRPSVTTRTCA